MILHIARALHGVRVDVAFELTKQVLKTLAHHIGQHIESATVRHADNRAIHTVISGQVENHVHDRHRRLGTLQPETFGADILRGQETFERLGGIQALQNHHRLGDEVVTMALDSLLHPALFVGVLNVHIFDADRAAVRVAQHTKQRTKRQARHTTHTAGGELAVKIPNGEAIREWVEFTRHPWRFPPQRVKIRDEMAAHAMHANESGHLHLFVGLQVNTVELIGVLTPLDGFIRHTETAENRFVKPVFTEQQLVHVFQKQAALGTLNNAMVVGARDGDHF